MAARRGYPEYSSTVTRAPFSCGSETHQAPHVHRAQRDPVARPSRPNTSPGPHCSFCTVVPVDLSGAELGEGGDEADAHDEEHRKPHRDVPQQVADALHDVGLVGKAEAQLGDGVGGRLGFARIRHSPSAGAFDEEGVAQEQGAGRGRVEEGVPSGRGHRFGKGDLRFDGVGLDSAQPRSMRSVHRNAGRR